MLFTIGMTVAGFVGGALLTALVAFYFYGVLHAEAASMVESYRMAARPRPAHSHHPHAASMRLRHVND